MLNAVSLLLLAGVQGERRAAIAFPQACELQRRRSDELHKAILAATCESCIAVLDRQGVIIEVNETLAAEGWEPMPSIPDNARSGVSYFDCLSSWSRSVESRQIAAALRWSVMSDDGEKRRFEYSVGPREGGRAGSNRPSGRLGLPAKAKR